MDLLQEGSVNKNKKTTGQKIILSLLIISIILVIVIIGLLYYLNNFAINSSIIINDKNETGNIEIIKLEDNSQYIPIKVLCKKLDLSFYNGEFNINGEDKDKCYIKNNKRITQFFANSKEIYKTEEDSNLDYEYYKLKNIILQKDGELYINIEDLQVGLNLICNYSTKKKKLTLMTPKYWIKQQKSQNTNNNYEILNSTDNLYAIANGYVIVESNNKQGVYNLKKEEIIGIKYNSIEFNEYTKQFIVSNNNNKYGIINDYGKTQIDLQYDSIEILNYDPLLYQVERQKKYGIIREDGTVIDEIKYSSIGYPKNIKNNIYYTLIIPEINENLEKSIVVCIDKKYGLISLENGRSILPCTFKGIFKVVDQDSKVYFAVKFEDNSIESLENYINSLNQITVNINS